MVGFAGEICLVSKLALVQVMTSLSIVHRGLKISLALYLEHFVEVYAV